MARFTRKIILSGGTLQINIPKIIVDKYNLKKGDLLEITDNQDESFTIRKSNND